MCLAGLGVVDARQVVIEVCRVINELRGSATKMRQRGCVDKASLNSVKAAFLVGYLPKSISEINIEELVHTVLDRYQMDSVNFFSLVVRDVLGSIVSSELTEESVKNIIGKVRRLLMQRLRRRTDRQKFFATTVERIKDERIRCSVASLFHSYSYWNHNRTMHPVPVRYDGVHV